MSFGYGCRLHSSEYARWWVFHVTVFSQLLHLARPHLRKPIVFTTFAGRRTHLSTAACLLCLWSRRLLVGCCPFLARSMTDSTGLECKRSGRGHETRMDRGHVPTAYCRRCSDAVNAYVKQLVCKYAYLTQRPAVLSGNPPPPKKTALDTKTDWLCFRQS